MNWNGIKIAYAPYHHELTAPGDRRRFVFYAKERNINFQLADPLQIYNIVYLTYGCNLTVWIEYKKKNPNVKFIFELIDSYLLENIGLSSIFRGFVWYIIQKESKFWINYKSALRKILSISDAVVCSTAAQKLEMLKFNNNVHLSLDYFSSDITHFKFSHEKKRPLKLVWEGQAYTVENLLLLNNILKKLEDQVELYILTDLFVRSPISFFDKKTNSILKKLKCRYHFEIWDKNNFSKIISDADLALIPINKNNAMMWNKPENKLLLFWEIGIPVLTTDTPSYKRVMNESGIDGCCASSNDWLRKIEAFINTTPQDRRDLSDKMQSYLRKFHSKELLLKNWDMIFDSLNMSQAK